MENSLQNQNQRVHQCECLYFLRHLVIWLLRFYRWICFASFFSSFNLHNSLSSLLALFLHCGLWFFRMSFHFIFYLNVIFHVTHFFQRLTENRRKWKFDSNMKMSKILWKDERWNDLNKNQRHNTNEHNQKHKYEKKNKTWKVCRSKEEKNDFIAEQHCFIHFFLLNSYLHVRFDVYSENFFLHSILYMFVGLFLFVNEQNEKKTRKFYWNWEIKEKNGGWYALFHISQFISREWRIKKNECNV